METNEFAFTMYQGEDAQIQQVPCAEYSASLQVELLNISLDKLQEPILDIGSGKKGALVSHLREKGFEAYGIDRFSSSSPGCSIADWLEFEYKSGYWGTILSHLGFSNHFRHHHLRSDGDYIVYARKFMEILHSLKPGGTFHYAPGLTFIEEYLNREEYQVTNMMVKEPGLYTTQVMKRVNPH